MISDKMIEAAIKFEVYPEEDDYGIPYLTKKEGGEVVKSAINAAWTRFDPEEKETWPKSSKSPSGMYWIVIQNGAEFNKTPISKDFFDTEGRLMWVEGYDTITAYADPADLMPTWKDET